MEISKNSWHFKLYRYICNIPKGPQYLNPFADVARSDPHLPSSLCPYAWSILLGIIGTAVTVTLFAAVAVVVGPIYAVGWTFSKAVAACRRVDEKVFAFKHRAAKETEPRKTRKQRERRPSIVVAFVKAHKDKVCPTIDLVD